MFNVAVFCGLLTEPFAIHSICYFMYLLITEKRVIYCKNNNNNHFNASISAVQGGVGNCCFNLLLSFPSIGCILSSQAILFQILLYALFLQFPWLILLPFPRYFKLHNLKYLGNDVLMDYMTIHCRQFCIISLIFATTRNTSPISKNIIQHPINQFHPTGLHKLQAHS